MILLSRLTQCVFFKACQFNKLTSKIYRPFCERPLEVNTNVAKDVILYKYDKPKFFKIVNIFGFCQFAFWTYLSMFAFTSLRNVPASKDDKAPWFRRVNFGEPAVKYSLTIGSFLVGFGCLTMAWMYTLRSVRYLVLNKGGQKISIVTYSPAGPNRIMTVDLKNVSCEESRKLAKNLLPLKVKGHFLYYVLDMKGEFRNPLLFDQTAGITRKLTTN